MKRCISIILLAVGAGVGNAGDAVSQVAQPLYVIDHPTAGLLDHGSYLIRARAGPESSLLAELGVGFKNLFHVGASFGMQNVLGYGSPELNDRIGFQLRFRIIQETNAPALAVGIDTQGQGRYHEDVERYDRKSTGFYVVLSKNYMFAVGDAAFHGGVSLTTEREDDDDPNLFLGIDWTILKRLAFVLDIDAALNDNAEGSDFGRGGIYIDGAVRLFYGESLMMTLIFRDLTGNGPDRSVGREFELAIIEFF